MRFEYKLDLIDEAKVSKLSKISRIGKSKSLEKSREQRLDEFFSHTEALDWMHFTLNLQMVIARYTGRLESFASVTLADEALVWRNISEKTSKRGSEIVQEGASMEKWKSIVKLLEAKSELCASISETSQTNFGQESELEFV